MNNEEFKNEFVEALKENLSERGNDVDVKVSTVEKMNQSYEAITITPEGSNIGMNMNLEVFAEAYESGVPFNEIVEQVTNKVEAHLADMPTFDVQSLTDYRILHHCQVISIKGESYRLKERKEMMSNTNTIVNTLFESGS